VPLIIGAAGAALHSVAMVTPRTLAPMNPCPVSMMVVVGVELAHDYSLAAQITSILARHPPIRQWPEFQIPAFRGDGRGRTPLPTPSAPSSGRRCTAERSEDTDQEDAARRHRMSGRAEAAAARVPAVSRRDRVSTVGRPPRISG
jgi:hypothetical protein